jgi:hypothetical protein
MATFDIWELYLRTNRIVKVIEISWLSVKLKVESRVVLKVYRLCFIENQSPLILLINVDMHLGSIHIGEYSIKGWNACEAFKPIPDFEARERCAKISKGKGSLVTAIIKSHL